MKNLRLPSLLAFLLVTTICAGAAMAQVVCVPNTLTLDTGTPTGDMVLDYTGGGSANLAGYSIEVVWDATLATAVFSRPDNGPFAGAVTFFVVTLGSGHVRIDAAIGGLDPGISAGELCKITFTGIAGQEGNSAVDLTVVHARDPDNVEVTGVTAVDGSLVVDLGAPVVANVLIGNDTLADTDDYVKDTDAVTITADVTDADPGFGAGNIAADLSGLGGGAAVVPDTYVAPVATWTLPAVVCSPADGTITVTITATDSNSNVGNGADDIIADNTAPSPLLGLTVLPGHEKLHLAWTDIAANDANPRSVVFRYAAWGDYPAYDTAAPAYPTDHLSGTDAVEATTGTAVDWAVVPRDVYYVAGFVTDMVQLTSPAGAENTGRATNYWLGDVAGASGYDGIVDVVNDINRLGTTYGLADAAPGYDAECDVGPTDTGSTRGVPEPNGDGEIGFEDMMVFALNYSVVTPTTKSAPGGTPLMAWRRVSPSVIALDLIDRGGDLQGLRLRADLPAGLKCSLVAGDLLAAQTGPVFLRDTPGADLDVGVAVFGSGAGFQGTGEILRLVFDEPAPDLGIDLIARNAENHELEISFESGGDASQVPVVGGFVGNFPNPFNPQTTLVFALPTAADVSVAVYGLDGRRVRTLGLGQRPAGRNEVVWDGRDDAGRPVATGTWFARLVAGDLRDTRKMVLVK